MTTKKLVAVLLCMVMLVITCAASATSAASTPDHTKKVELTVCFLSTGNKTDELQRITDAVNKILLEKYNAEVNLVEIGLEDYVSKMNLMLATGEKADILQGFLGYDTYVANGYFMPLDDYEYLLEDSIALLGDYANMGRSNGHLWGLPAIKDIAQGEGYILRKDYVEETGIDVDSIVDYESFGNLLYKLKELHPELAPISGPLSALFVYGEGEMIDKLGSDQLLGVLLEPTTSSKVENFYTSDRFVQTCEYAYQWAQDGLITYDGGTDYMGMVQGGRAMGTQYVWTPKAETEVSLTVGEDMIFVKPNQCNAIATTSNYFTWCISDYCEEPERACEVLNELFTNKEINNLLAWGIEGEDYVLVDADSGSGVIKFPEGKDSTTVGYYQFTKFGLPNNFQQYVLEGTDPELWQKMDTFNKEADISVALGFSFDVTAVANQIAACTNVVNEYNNALLTGQMDPSVKLAEFQQKLVDNGINDIISEKQAQLDAWLAGNSK
jgi:putative aldouronate transport system substrate-binding protein